MHRSCFCKHGVEERIIFHWSHMVTLFFRDTGKTICVRGLPNSPIKKIWNAKKNLQRATETVLRKECREILTNTFDSGATSGSGYFKKILQEGSTVVSLRNWAYSLLYNSENTSQLSHKSRVLHTSSVCACGVYKRVGPPAFLTFLLYSNVDKIYV